MTTNFPCIHNIHSVHRLLLPMATLCHHRLLLSLFYLLTLLPILSSADDSTVMSTLLSSLSPAPSDWSSSSRFCTWTGVSCDSSSFVTSINLAGAGVSGTLPLELNQLWQLQSLSLQRNSLTGTLPSFENITSLEQIYLDNNDFTMIPNNFLLGLRNLSIFNISLNIRLSPWQIPSYLAESTSLAVFCASNASLTGNIPDLFDSFPNLQDLRLSYNNLTGSLPGSFAGSGIQNLWLNNQAQGLSGGIDVLGSMTHLTQAWLQANAFTGGVPDLSRCTNLFDLQLRDNRFTGVLPFSLMGLPALVNITLQNNVFQGPYPQFPPNVHAEIGGSNTDSFCSSSSSPCDPQVNTLLEIAGALGYPMSLAQSWQGNNACNNWRFINCDSQGKHVTVVDMGRQGFLGRISPAFVNLTSLQTLVLSDNNLTGVIPGGLISLPKLTTFDVSNNNCSGPIPVIPANLKFTHTGNSFLVDGGGASVSRPSPGMIGGVVIAVVVFVGAASLVSYKCYVKRHDNRVGVEDRQTRSNRFSGDHGEIPIGEGGKVAISIEIIRQVTNNFDRARIVGKGGFGVVYKGELHDGTKVAVKRMKSGIMGTKGMNELQVEIGVLTKVRHKHLVAFLGYCVSGIERLLVFEYMPKGMLSQHLFRWQELGLQPLSWKQRLIIALDVAKGVEYLHSLAQESFIHRDLKPSNVLLSGDMRAKVADFGLVKNVPNGKYSISTRLAGTLGYLAPEYVERGKVTRKVDIYAFGVILMEMITGRKSLDNSLSEDRFSLVPWLRGFLINKKDLRDTLDPMLEQDDETYESICRVADLAGHCTASEPFQRPDIGQAINVLGPLVDPWIPCELKEEEGLEIHVSSGRELWITEGQTKFLNRD